MHSGPEADRHHFDAVAGPRDMPETYLPAFEALVEGRGRDRDVRLQPHERRALLRQQGTAPRPAPRGEWGFQGHVVSDCGAIDDFDTGHKITRDRAESVALALKSGTNLACTDYSSLNDALRRGLVTEGDVNKALAHLLRTRFKLGLFDPDDRNPYTQIPTSVIGSEPHRRLAREAAVKSLVLLKNKDGALPLRKDLKKVYVTGPLAADAFALIANYYGVHEDLSTVLEGIVGKVSPATSVEFRQGALLDRPNSDNIDRFTATARDSEITIAVVGINNLIEGEEGAAIASPHRGDRPDLGLPGSQLEFLRALRKAARKLVVVVMGGSPLTISEVHDLADAVLFIWYPGQEGGRAVADVLFGDASPSGTPADHIPALGGPAPALRGLLDAGPDLQIHEAGAALSVRLRVELRALRVRSVGAVEERVEGRRKPDRPRGGQEHGWGGSGRGRAALRHGARLARAPVVPERCATREAGPVRVQGGRIHDRPRHAQPDRRSRQRDAGPRRVSNHGRGVVAGRARGGPGRARACDGRGDGSLAGI